MSPNHSVRLGLAVALALVSAPASWAQLAPTEASISAPTLPQAVDQKSRLDQFWPESTVAGDAAFMFGIQYDDIKIRNAAKDLSIFYRDVLVQQSEDQPIIRTRDLVSPFSSSLYELEQAPLGTGF